MCANDFSHLLTFLFVNLPASAGSSLVRTPGFGNGLSLVLQEEGFAKVTKGADLLPIIVDRVKVQVLKDGKPKGSRIAAAHLNSMLKAESFLSEFTTVDQITDKPKFLPDFSLTMPGFNDGGDGFRIHYGGAEADVSDSLDIINAFLDVMPFETEADRTNAVAAALTVMLHNHWPGGKPIIVVTANKSHAGKDTVIAFATGSNESVSISYQATNWALERTFVGAVKQRPDTAVVVVENARLDRRDRMIASAFIERFATDPKPLLFSTGTGSPVRCRNDIVMAISTNYGTVSKDIMNRALPIHLNAVGNVADRNSPIGNPKHEFLPANRDSIAAELRGMIQRWTAMDQPLDEEVRHSFGPWAKTIGGILKVNGFSEFLANFGIRTTADDPVRNALGLLGESCPDEWAAASEWTKHVVDLGLTKIVIPVGDQHSEKGRVRGVGVVMSHHRDETFEIETDSVRLKLKLEKRRGRWDGSEPQVRYRFVGISSEPLKLEEN